MPTNNEIFDKWKKTHKCDCKRRVDIKTSDDWNFKKMKVKVGEKSTLAFHFNLEEQYCRCQVEPMTEEEIVSYKALLDERKKAFEEEKRKREENNLAIAEEKDSMKSFFMKIMNLIKRA